MMIINNIIDEFLLNWSAYFNSSKPESIQYYMYLKGDRNFILLFEMASKVPFACAKTSFLRNNFQPFDIEWDSLNYVRYNSSANFKEKVPRPLFKVSYGDEFGFVMTYIDGSAININGIASCYNSTFVLNIFNQVLVLWKDYLALPIRNTLLTIDILNHKLKCIQSLYYLSFPNDPRMINEFNQLKCRIDGLTNIKTCIGPVHGDFWIGNFINSKSELYLIDWERSHNNALPIFDIFLFCTTLLQKGNIKSNFEYVFCRNNKVNCLVKNLIKEASLFLDINAELAIILYEMFLIERSVQGLMHYNKKIVYDEEWKYRLELFLDNKEMILYNNFTF